MGVQNVGTSLCDLLKHMSVQGAEHLVITAYDDAGEALHHIAVTLGEHAEKMAGDTPTKFKDFVVKAEQEAQAKLKAAFDAATKPKTSVRVTSVVDSEGNEIPQNTEVPGTPPVT